VAERQYILGIDSSTSSTKAIVWDLGGHVIAAGRGSISYEQPRRGWAVQNAESWWQSTTAAVQEALRSLDPAQILAVGLTWQRETIVPLDVNGKPLRDGIVWMDERGLDEVAEVRAAFGTSFCDLTGKPLDITPSVFKIMWLKRHEPAEFARTALFLDVGAYLTRRLTGRCRTCSAGADTMGLVDMAQRSWSSEILTFVGLRMDQLPELVEPGELLGTVSAEGSRATGLREGTPVVAGGGDGQCSALGSGALDAETYSMSLGTGLSLDVHLPRYLYDPAFRTLIGCVPRSYLAEVNTRSCSLLIQWFLREFMHIECQLSGLMSVRTEELLDLSIGRLSAGSDGLLTLPYWRGVMMPRNNPMVRGMTLGWSDYHTKAHFYRSLLEGLAFEFRQRLEAVEQVLNQPCSRIQIGAGGSQSAVWCQIISDVTHKTLGISESPETTSLGSAMLAATASGAFSSLEEAVRAMHRTVETVSPIERNSRVYDAIYGRVYVHLLPLLEEYMVTLREITVQ